MGKFTEDNIVFQLVHAVATNDLERVKELANKVDLTLQAQGHTPLSMAIEHCNLNAAQVLIEAGADANGLEPGVDMTHLMEAVGLMREIASYDRWPDDCLVRMVRLLLEHGADPDRQAPDGSSARTYARSPQFRTIGMDLEALLDQYKRR